MAKVTTLDDLFLDELRDLYSAEKQLTKALPKMAKGVASDQLRAAIEAHLEETEGHVQRLEQIFETLGEKGTGKTCAAMEGLIKEGSELLTSLPEGPVRDAGVIGAAQKVEHYEISGYGTARTHAQILGHEEIVSLLQATEDEEKAADYKLTEIAESVINEEALDSGEAPAKPAASQRSSSPRTKTAGGR
jgi:ferritin-like metal-binding protein YciE